MQDLTYVTYCGLYCKLCDNIGRLPKQASNLRKSLQKGGWEYFGSHVMSGFNEFWTGLEQLTQIDQNFKGCRGCGCGDPDCKIRQCAQKLEIVCCSSCKDYPCSHIHSLGKRYPNLISDGFRQKEVGIDKWIQEQEERCKTGFCYCDIRYDH